MRMKSVVEQSTNSDSTTKHVKYSSNFEFDENENVRSSNVVEFELRHISSMID